MNIVNKKVNNNIACLVYFDIDQMKYLAMYVAFTTYIFLFFLI